MVFDGPHSPGLVGVVSFTTATSSYDGSIKNLGPDIARTDKSGAVSCMTDQAAGQAHPGLTCRVKSTNPPAAPDRGPGPAPWDGG